MSTVIVKNFALHNKDKVTIIHNNTKSLGACQNFAQLIYKSKQDYIMFCDQDDVWLPDKIALTLRKLQEEETIKGKNYPLMIFTDLTLTDSDNNEIAKSFWDYEHINPKRTSLKNILVQNISTGCTVMFNRALLDKVTVIPQTAIVHDWWFALLATSFGALIHLDIQTIQYRQHEANCIGARRWSLFNKVNNLVAFSKFINTYRETFNLTYYQTDSFLSIYKNDLTPAQINIFTEYVNIASASWFGKRVRTIKNGFFRHGVVRKLAQLLFM
jgi:glycosyltransferase involved in cell wall biosynthesis